jgi:simple sugar transport system ATP-binding protein
VLRKGRLVKSLSATGVAPDEVVRLVIGDKSLTPPSRRELETGATVLGMQGVVTAAEHGGVALSGVDLQIRSGEILGVAGVAGNGQRELVETLAGLRRVKKGRVEFHGRDITRSSTARRIRSRIAVLPADRIRDGILAAAPLYETFALGSHLSSSGRWSLRSLRRNALHMIEEYGVAASGPSAATGGLSGGNIQKVLVARAMRILGGDAGGLLVAANPTNGLDVGASSFVHHQLLAAKGAGSAVLLLSEDLDELFELSDRVVVLEGGRLHGDFARESFDRREVGALMVASND